MKTIKPKLTEREYVELFLFMTPQEMKQVFPEGSTSSVATIYRIVENYYQGDKQKIKKELHANLMYLCEYSVSAEENEKDVEHWIAMAKAELVSRIMKRLEIEAGLFV